LSDSLRDQRRDLPDCNTVDQTCLAACPTGDLACSSNCDAALTQCLEDCAHCKANCNADRIVCGAAAKTAQDTDNQACDDLQATCGTTCTDPIDSSCVRPCGVTRRGCDLGVKKNANTCKRACVRGPARRACVRGCRAQLNIDLGGCSDQEVTCLAGCAGMAP